jgi:hypothetical protein
MKVLIILALSCSVFARPDEPAAGADHGVPPLPPGLKESCPGRCIFQDRYKEWVLQSIPKAKEFGRKLAEESGGAAATAEILPELHPEKWEKACTEVGTVRTCIQACTDAADAERKTKAEAILTAAADIVCDAEIKGKAVCIQNVAKTPSPACNTACNEFKTPLIESYNAYKTTGTRDWEKAKTAGANVCKLLNCRLKCRKTDITTACGADGYEAAKKLMKELATLGKTTHAQFRPAANFPEECNPETIITGA